MRATANVTEDAAGVQQPPLAEASERAGQANHLFAVGRRVLLLGHGLSLPPGEAVVERHRVDVLNVELIDLVTVDGVEPVR